MSKVNLSIIKLIRLICLLDRRIQRNPGETFVVFYRLEKYVFVRIIATIAVLLFKYYFITIGKDSNID